MSNVGLTMACGLAIGIMVASQSFWWVLLAFPAGCLIGIFEGHN